MDWYLTIAQLKGADLGSESAVGAWTLKAAQAASSEHFRRFGEHGVTHEVIASEDEHRVQAGSTGYRIAARNATGD
jgi:hypothetical protein